MSIIREMVDTTISHDVLYNKSITRREQQRHRRCCCFLLLSFTRANVNKSCIFYQNASRHRHNVRSARTKPSRPYFTIASITISAHPLVAINNISVGGQVGVFPQLLRLS